MAMANNADRPEQAAQTGLPALAGHAHAIPGNLSLEGAQQEFARHRYKFMAVTENGRAIGLCSRDRINEKLGSRFGHSIYAKRPVRDHLLAHPEIVPVNADIPAVLKRVFSRPSERFYEDILVVDAAQQLVGLIAVDTLIHFQNSLLEEKIRQLEQNHSTLEEQKAKLESLADQLEAANAELSLARDDALEGTRLKSEFLANMSHEIRTPMNGIAGMVSLLMETELSEEQRHFATTVHKSADSLLNIINDILDFSKIEAGKLEINPEETPIRELIEEIVHTLAEAAASKRLEFILDIDADVPEWLVTDPLRYRQVLINLLGNAIKFTGAGEVVVKIRIERDAYRGLFLRTEVHDSGIGISRPDQERLFQAFIQGDGSTNRKYGGTGLGLAISRKLVTLMEGFMGCESSKGQGATFWFDLPLGGAGPSERRRTAHPFPPQLRALVIDDHALTRDILCRQIALLGISSQSADCAASGLRAVREAYERGESFDYVLVDLDMPETDGLEVCRQISQDPDLDELRVILLTIVGQSSNRKKFSEYGVNKTLYKPVCPSDLESALHSTRPELPASRRQSARPVENATAPLPPVEPMRVLLAEDSEANQAVAIGILEKLGCEVYLAMDGHEALDLLRAGEFDCILMDCQMPRLDGYAATRAIREGYHGIRQQDIHIIAMTAHAMQGDRQKCLQAGMNDYLSKPVTLHRMAEVLSHYQHTRRGRNSNPA
ncbi:response regulator [Ruficoccus amylovorans]|uniref:Sensory/regulatory protein RpfC n=1 Tax=Ruficoccus amylovorans TaxID=1804625 RepID=A0A842HHB7_9BACT|nr:response regulator [Ruficoccus amylovorans]MBC2595388.1 response regulator [Ruficoccus amylovorans]